MKKLFALLALIAFASITLAATPWYQGEYNKVSDTWSLWGPIAVVGVIVAFLVVAVAYMFGIGFDLPELKMWAKAEFYQALASTVLVCGLLSMTWLMMDSGAARIIGQNIDPFSLANSYLADLGGKLHDLYKFNYYTNYPVEGASSLSLYTNAVGFDIYLLSFLKPLLIEPLHLSNYYVLQFLIVISMWMGVLDFFKTSAFATFLPLGVFMRIFPPTRGAGGLLIAIAIGFFIVFPTMFAFITMMTADETAFAQQLAGQKSTVGVSLAEFNACDQDVEGVAQDAESSTDPSMLAEINTYFSFLGPTWMKIFFYPMVVMAVTITFIKVMAPLLGSDISEIGQGLIRLI